VIVKAEAGTIVDPIAAWSGADPMSVSVKLCGAGFAPPAIALNSRPVGPTSGGGVAVDGATTSTIETTCGELGADGAVITTCP
jgi:hypothetical protein